MESPAANVIGPKLDRHRAAAWSAMACRIPSGCEMAVVVEADTECLEGETAHRSPVGCDDRLYRSREGFALRQAPA